MAVNCIVVPAGVDGEAGVTAMDFNVAAVTVRVVLPTMPPEVAEMLLLSVCGGAVGTGLGMAGVRLLTLVGTDRLPLGASVSFDGRTAALGSAALGVVTLLLLLTPSATAAVATPTTHATSVTPSTLLQKSEMMPNFLNGKVVNSLYEQGYFVGANYTHNSSFPGEPLAAVFARKARPGARPAQAPG